MNVDALLSRNLFTVDQEPHILIEQQICASACSSQACLAVCPADLFHMNDQRRLVVAWEGCLECGTCMICCDKGALTWNYPRSGFGVQYRMS